MKPEDNQENFKKCVCGECLVHAEYCRERNELLFCARTNSACEIEQNQKCICGSCPVYFENMIDCIIISIGNC